MFRTTYDRRLNRFVGRCSLHPLAAHYADSAEEAMLGIIAYVSSLDADNEVTDVKSNPHADTDVDGIVREPIIDPWSRGHTDTRWPPFTET